MSIGSESQRALCRLDDTTATKLAKICGMFGSDHAGERAAAAALAHQLIRSMNLTWADVIGLRETGNEIRSRCTEWREPESLADALELARQYEDMLTDWERQFIRGLGGCRRVSEKQATILEQVIAKIRDRYAQEAA